MKTGDEIGNFEMDEEPIRKPAKLTAMPTAKDLGIMERNWRNYYETKGIENGVFTHTSSKVRFYMDWQANPPKAVQEENHFQRLFNGFFV
uniref:DUF4913 domain-containing protein n=1 Tax=Angiostrongylus cantonensis TaxID=6313 RepID=A0A0K0DEL5_ANGCA